MVRSNFVLSALLRHFRVHVALRIVNEGHVEQLWFLSISRCPSLAYDLLDPLVSGRLLKLLLEHEALLLHGLRAVRFDAALAPSKLGDRSYTRFSEEISVLQNGLELLADEVLHLLLVVSALPACGQLVK